MPVLLMWLYNAVSNVWCRVLRCISFYIWNAVLYVVLVAHLYLYQQLLFLLCFMYFMYTVFES